MDRASLRVGWPRPTVKRQRVTVWADWYCSICAVVCVIPFVWSWALQQSPPAQPRFVGKSATNCNWRFACRLRRSRYFVGRQAHCIDQRADHCPAVDTQQAREGQPQLQHRAKYVEPELLGRSTQSEMASRRCKHRLPVIVVDISYVWTREGCIHHSDRGSQYSRLSEVAAPARL